VLIPKEKESIKSAPEKKFCFVAIYIKITPSTGSVQGDIINALEAPKTKAPKNPFLEVLISKNIPEKGIISSIIKAISIIKFAIPIIIQGLLEIDPKRVPVNAEINPKIE